MNRKQRTLLFAALAIVLVAGVAVFVFSGGSGTPPVPYKTFYDLVLAGEVKGAVIEEKSITYTTTGGGTFRTQNPNSPTLVETLLLHGVTVTEEGSAAQTVSLVFDVLFYAFFFGVIFIVFRKFISPNTFKPVRKTGVTFENIVGMDAVKRDLAQIADMMKRPDAYKKRGVRLPKGILLEGGPGNGKTLFARALAEEAGVPFIPAKATDFESMFMAIGPMKVKLLFKKARRNAPCIVFIDEFDGIGTKRNYSGSAIETENTRIVTALLNELDGFTPHDGILVVAATNSRAALDEALIRPGRFDTKYVVPQPDSKTRAALARMYLAGKRYAADVTPEKIAELTAGKSCALVESVLNRAPLIAAQSDRDEFTLADVTAALRET